MVTSQLPSPKSPASAPKKHLRVLYADDMPELRDIVRLCLSRDGHGIECVADGQLALNRLMADGGFDLVITDHHMPNMKGLDLVGHLRSLPFRGKIVVFSSELSADVADEYRKFGVDRIIYKPIFPSALRGLLNDLFPPAAAVQVEHQIELI